MKKFCDVVKVNFDEDIEKYFQNVEVESIKTNKAKDTLNFYIVSKDIIPYHIRLEAEKQIAKDLLNIDGNEYKKRDVMIKPVNIFAKYDIDSKWTCKNIYDIIKKDLRKELSISHPIANSLIRDEYLDWTDDNTLRIGFDHIDAFKKQQDEIVDYLKKEFKEKFNRELNIDILWLENSYSANTEKSVKNKSEIYDRRSNNTENEKAVKGSNIEKGSSVNAETIRSVKDRHHKKSQITSEGDILFAGRKSRVKCTYKEISKLLYEMDNIETKGVIYNIKKFMPKEKDFAIYSIFITDEESCIEVKFFGDKIDEVIFDKRFLIGDEVSVEGKVTNDSYARTFVITPYSIKFICHRTVIEYGKVGEDEYYNEIVTDRKDNERVKRVELHLHTKSSEQDGIGDIKQYIETAKRFGMNAMAITDHGSVNALADAYEYIGKDKNFKIINGVEGYLVEDAEFYYFDKDNKEINDSFSFDNEYVIYELITTGFNRKNDAIIKIVATKIKDRIIVSNFSSFVRYDKPLSLEVKDRTGILPSNVEDAKELKEVLHDFADFVGSAVLVTSNKNSTWKLNEIFIENGIDNDFKYLDFTIIARLLLKDLKSSHLISIARELDVKVDGITNRKREEKKKEFTIDETMLLSVEVFIALLKKFSFEFEINDLKDLHNVIGINDNFLKRQKYYHIIILAKNDVGRVNLYKIVSDSHVKYMYNKRPRIPRALLTKYREGLIIGSACILGEFMDAVKNNLSDEKLKEIASFYDYLEIQPTLNNSFLLTEEANTFKTISDLENLSKKVVEIGEELDKPVVATCDCHYVEKNDKIFRDILRAGIMAKKVNRDKDGNVKQEVTTELESSNQELLYFRTTKEMLDEFAFLGTDKAYEVVVKNTNLISDMIERVNPVRPDNCPPHIEGSDEELRNTCYENLKKIYGENPPSEIKERLDNELKYIIDNGYSVMYIAAKKLIDYSRECGYPVGSRGSVGSSLAAALSGVSEVNPLKPHYICPKCHHIEYDTEETRKYDNDTGFDMPDKVCPECGMKMDKNGINIPFETFLGIPGKSQKEPDIDLNFCSVFQSQIHNRTIELFGKENTYKAGTVGTVAAKTAYGYVMRFKEMTGLDLNKNQIDFYKNKIVECKNTTGQHPGGMVVVPENEKIYTFTPINIAAGKEGNNITTHYDYHKIDKNLLKLDILGHESPLILKKLEEATGVPFSSVPFYEKDVLKLFEDTSSLGISPSDISGTRLGCLTIPEFGTDTAIGMCIDAKPKTVADLIRISGLAHGTDVWRGNVQDLIKNGDCTLSTAICCRDDIMIYLIEKGIDSGNAFKIMEKVRKGKKLGDDNMDEMRAHGVPEWYIGCCNKIQYMFPKAHAAAYVLASLRIAYYKVHYPLEYYAVYFSIDNNKNGFDYKLMMKEKDEIHYHIEKIAKIINERKSRDRRFAAEMEIASRPVDAIKKMYMKLNGVIEEEEEKAEDDEASINRQYETMSASKLLDLYMCYRHVEEMKARRIDFCPIDIYKAKRSDFQVIDGRIMPSFDALDGIGTKEYEIDYDDKVSKELKSTAMKCEIEGRLGEYSSIENFVKRTGVKKPCVAEMKELGILSGLREKEETTIFDFLN